MRRLLVNILVLLVTLALLVPFSEFAVRMVFSDVTTTGGDLSWFERRWNEGNVRFNRWGYRDREVEQRKRPGTYRILVIGDSFTYAPGVAFGERYTERVQDALRGGDRPYEVINAGQPGAETVQHARALLAALRADPYPDPDFVLVQWYVNDVEGADKRGRDDPAPLWPDRPQHYRLVSRSALYYVLDRQWGALQRTLGRAGSYPDYMRARFGDPRSAESMRASSELRCLLRLAKDNGLDLGVVLFPVLRHPTGDGYPFAFLHERMLDICAQEGVPCLDLRETYSGWEPADRELWANRFDSHPGPLAHRLAAQRLLERFAGHWQGGPVGARAARQPVQMPAGCSAMF